METPGRQRGAELAGTALIVGAALLVLRPFLVPIAWAAVLAFASWPVFTRIERRLGGGAGRGAPALLATVRGLPVVGPELADRLAGILADPARLQEWAVARAGTLVVAITSAAGDVGRFAIETVLIVFTLFFVYRDGGALAPAIDRAARRLGGARAGARCRNAPPDGPDGARGDVRHALHRSDAGRARHDRVLGRGPPRPRAARRPHRHPGAHTGRRGARVRAGRRVAPAPGAPPGGHPPAPVGRRRREHGGQRDPLVVPRRRRAHPVPAGLLRRAGRPRRLRLARPLPRPGRRRAPPGGLAGGGGRGRRP